MSAEKFTPLIPKDPYNPDLRQGFFFEGKPFHVLQRLDEGKGISSIYLAQNEDGTKVCLTLFDKYGMAQKFQERGYANIDTLIQSSRELFMTEPQTLQKLENEEQKHQTHDFPRLLSGVFDPHGTNPSYITEYIESTDIRSLPATSLKKYQELFAQAIHLAQAAGVHFPDLSVEDLRILPTEEIMIIDFNRSQYEHSLSIEEANQKDEEMLQFIFSSLQ